MKRAIAWLNGVPTPLGQRIFWLVCFGIWASLIIAILFGLPFSAAAQVGVPTNVDPCHPSPETYAAGQGGGGGGWPVSDAATEFNTGGILIQDSAIERNTSVIQQLQEKLCEAQEQASKDDEAVTNAPVTWHGSNAEVPAPGANLN